MRKILFVLVLALVGCGRGSNKDKDKEKELEKEKEVILKLYQSKMAEVEAEKQAFKESKKVIFDAQIAKVEELIEKREKEFLQKKTRGRSEVET